MVILEQSTFFKSKGNATSPDTLKRRLNRVLKQFEIPYKRGVLRDDTRIMYIANHKLNGQEIEKLLSVLLSVTYNKKLQVNNL